MSLLKRHTGRGRRAGRRVVGVIVGASLLVLGLEAPAFAVPAITGISPTSGPDDCVVVITGSGFDQPGDFAVAAVRFTGGTSINEEDAIFHVVSDTEIWTTVPAAAEDGPITVSDGQTPTPAAANSPVFDVTTTAGGCAPTITSFTPTCGVVGTAVTITGTNLLKSSGDDVGPPVAAPVGADVRFNPYTAPPATHTGAAESPSTISVNVPAGALTGPIQVTTFPGSTVASTGSFEVVTDASLCPTDGEPTTHERNVRLRLRRHLIARGKVTVPDGFSECAQNVPVKIQRKRSGGWRTVKVTNTSVTGSFKKRIPDRPGAYRAVARKITLPESGDVCLKDVSNRARHRH